MDVCSLTELFKVSRDELITEQDAHPSLKPFIASALFKETPEMESSCYFMNEGLLCSQWVSNGDSFLTLCCKLLYQIS